MKKYILKRILLGIIALFGVILITFIVSRVVPSDPAAKWAGPRATPEQIELARSELGFDDPYPIQFVNYIVRIVHGDLGKSLRTHSSVTDELKIFVPATVELVLLATVIAFIVGIPLGLYSAKYKNRLLDHFSRFFAIGAVSLPGFWVALGLQLIFYRHLGWFPVGGRVSVIISLMHRLPNITGMLVFDSFITGNWYIFKDAAWHIVLPVVVLSLYPMGLVTRMTRSALLEILNEDYITAARSYGLSERLILVVYALRNSLGPTITAITLSTGYTLVSTFLVESIFGWPGMGNYLATAVIALDYPAIMGVTIFSAVSYLFLNLIADIVVSLDPRVRL